MATISNQPSGAGGRALITNDDVLVYLSGFQGLLLPFDVVYAQASSFLRARGRQTQTSSPIKPMDFTRFIAKSYSVGNVIGREDRSPVFLELFQGWDRCINHPLGLAVLWCAHICAHVWRSANLGQSSLQKNMGTVGKRLHLARRKAAVSLYASLVPAMIAMQKAPESSLRSHLAELGLSGGHPSVIRYRCDVDDFLSSPMMQSIIDDVILQSKPSMTEWTRSKFHKQSPVKFISMLIRVLCMPIQWVCESSNRKALAEVSRLVRDILIMVSQRSILHDLCHRAMFFQVAGLFSAEAPTFPSIRELLPFCVHSGVFPPAPNAHCSFVTQCFEDALSEQSDRVARKVDKLKQNLGPQQSKASEAARNPRMDNVNHGHAADTNHSFADNLGVDVSLIDAIFEDDDEADGFGAGDGIADADPRSGLSGVRSDVSEIERKQRHPFLRFSRLDRDDEDKSSNMLSAQDVPNVLLGLWGLGLALARNFLGKFSQVVNLRDMTSRSIVFKTQEKIIAMIRARKCTKHAVRTLDAALVADLFNGNVVFSLKIRPLQRTLISKWMDEARSFSDHNHSFLSVTQHWALCHLLATLPSEHWASILASSGMDMKIAKRCVTRFIAAESIDSMRVRVLLGLATAAPGWVDENSILNGSPVTKKSPLLSMSVFRSFARFLRERLSVSTIPLPQQSCELLRLCMPAMARIPFYVGQVYYCPACDCSLGDKNKEDASHNRDDTQRTVEFEEAIRSARQTQSPANLRPYCKNKVHRENVNLGISVHDINRMATIPAFKNLFDSEGKPWRHVKVDMNPDPALNINNAFTRTVDLFNTTVRIRDNPETQPAQCLTNSGRDIRTAPAQMCFAYPLSTYNASWNMLHINNRLHTTCYLCSRAIQAKGSVSTFQTCESVGLVPCVDKSEEPKSSKCPLCGRDCASQFAEAYMWYRGRREWVACRLCTVCGKAPFVVEEYRRRL